MTDALLSLVPDYGLWLLFAATFMSCIALPVPAMLFMLAGGAFVASGDLSGWQAVLASYGGAVLGDQAGYALGRVAHRPLLARISRRPARRALFEKAAHRLERNGASAVFLSRWLISPLGPYINFIGGASGLSWIVFSVWSLAGEGVWVGLYISLGDLFANRVAELGNIVANISAALVAGTVTLGLGFWLRTVLREHKPGQHR